MRISLVVAGITALLVGGGVLFFFQSSQRAPAPPPIAPTPSLPVAQPSPPTPPPESPQPTAPTPSQEPQEPRTNPIPEPQSPNVTPREPQEFIVRVRSATEYVPADLTIHVGDTITFINEDDELRWPGADPHPTHSALPAFDAFGGISPGQSYSYTFTKPGTLGHHDHLPENPIMLGYITVLP